MSTNLSPENEAFLAEAVSRGVFPNPETALEEAVRLLRRKLDVESQLIAGLESGQSILADDAYWETKRAELLRRSGLGP